MSAKTPTVSAVSVYDEAQPAWSVRLDTAAWVAWLEEPTTTRFAYPLFDPAKGYIVGRMTVRKERRVRGGTYWTAYRRTCGRLRKVYLGRTETLTQARLEEIASLLREANDGRASPPDQHAIDSRGGGLLFDEHRTDARPTAFFDDFDDSLDVDRNISVAPFLVGRLVPFSLDKHSRSDPRPSEHTQMA